MESLRVRQPEMAFSGLGGGEMAALSGGAVQDWVEEAGVVGLVEVLKKYGWFRRKFAETLSRIREQQPRAVVLIDYPGFNLRLAAALRGSGYRGKIIYYISPQVWAWHRSRIPKMGRMLDLMICIFPFEKDLYEGCGLKTVFAGHPLVDYHRKRLTGAPREPGLIGLFPGSRRREITKLFPIMLEAARLMQHAQPDLRFVASAASDKLAGLMREMAESAPVSGLVIETGTAHALMQRVECGAVASGTATLEAAIFGLPHCLVYRVSPGTYHAGRLLIQVRWLGIVNLLAGREVVRELIQETCTDATLATELLRLHSSPDSRRHLASDLSAVVNALGSGDAYARAAEAVLRTLGE